MDYAIFDSAGAHPLFVIEGKQLGTELKGSSPQLARYLSQMADLRFGILTDGCTYMFYGDLNSPNQMDAEPFFSFALNDPKMDLEAVAKTLAKFSRDSFNAETLVTEAENTRYRQAMVERIAKALKQPAEDESFLKWLVSEVYDGSRTANVLARMGAVAREAINPALALVISDDFIAKLREGMTRSWETKEDATEAKRTEDAGQDEVDGTAEDTDDSAEGSKRRKIETTEEEMAFYGAVRDICARDGIDPNEILWRDTVNYFNVSHLKPSKWFVRFFGDARRKCVTTLLSVEEARECCSGFDVDEPPGNFGASRIYLDDVPQVWAIKDAVIRSLNVLRARKDDPQAEGSSPTN
jgi:hypothetical protein